MTNWQISVIIPVYNAGKYVRQAVESALIQPETAEIILFEDGSPDDSLAVCQQLASEYDKVKLFQHENGINRGAGITRNEAVKQAQHDYIAFLDADDYFLPNHLRVATQTLENNPALDGVYNACGWYYEDEASRQRTKAYGLDNQKLTTTISHLSSEGLFRALTTSSHWGSFTIIALVMKKSLFWRVGGFDNMRHEDDVIRIKFAAIGNIVGGQIDSPLVMLRVHPKNRTHEVRPASVTYGFRMKVGRTLIDWGKREGLSKTYLYILYDRWLGDVRRYRNSDRRYPKWMYPILERIRLLEIIPKYPEVLFLRAYWVNQFHFIRQWLWDRKKRRQQMA